ncbi:hypothetical protein CDD82_3953 [Ophiocordyceps australis]|uniref:Nephrocystin 3-like N-terminal domain-containing protein n=1 Tax=Ophiocordyceps australis TaxID=1399860 RepID=A0A2C5XM10_9HYPO|nr:hypothetical protein CDD82_3953 [Ophiocordyceps australis]
MTRKDKYTQRFDQGLSKLKKTIRSVFNDSAPGSVQEAAKDGGSASKRPESPGPTSDGGKQGIARDDANTNALVDPKISTAPSSKTDGAEQGSARDDANTNAIVDPNIPTAPSSKTMVLVASDLWARAVEELDEKERKKLKPIPQSVQRNGGGDDWLPDVTVIINSTVDILEKKEAEKNTQSNLQNILRTALVAKSLGDAMAKFDTSGYAALGWSIATFGIQIALNAKDSRESILKGAEIVTSFMTRYAEYDKLFGKELPNKEFERLRVRSYAAMLRYIIELKDYLDKGRIEHAGAAVIKPQDRMYEKSKVDLDAADAKVKEYLPIVNQEISQTFQSTMMEFIQRISINSEPYLKSLQSLAFPEMDDRPKDIDKKGTQQGTCEWLLKHDKYTRWNASDVGLLWIKGKAGSGKSTLLRYAYNHAIPAPESNNTTLVLSYFFHGRGTELQKSPLGLFRSLLHQILKAVPDAATEFTSQYQQRCKDYGKPGEQWEWHVQDLTSHFEKILPKVSSQGHPVLIYIDALDECGEENAHHLIEQFQALLKRLAENRETQLRICFGCRDYPIGLVEYGSEIRPEAENALDIENFVTNKLEGAGIRDETMRNQVVKGANGLFMWARLTTDRIIRRRRQGWSIKRIRDEINEQHKDLDGLYRDLVDGMEDKQMSLRLMQWVSFSKRPMKLDAILLPMALDLDDDSPVKSYDYYKRLIPGSMEDKESYIHTLSAGLIEVVHSVGLYNEKKVIVQFIHQSVKDYFEKEGLRKLYPADTAATFDIDVIRDSNFQLARHCLEFFELDGINDKNMADLTFRLPFLNYALGAFREHLRRSDERDGEQKIIYDLFQRHAATLTALATGRTHFKPPKNSLVPLHFIAVEYGLSQTFTAMFQNGVNTSAQGPGREARSNWRPVRRNCSTSIRSN